MIALASAMKTTMSNAAASWSGGGYSSAVASSGYASGGGSPYAYGKEITVKVTGTLEASGSKLKAILNNEATRSAVTT